MGQLAKCPFSPGAQPEGIPDNLIIITKGKGRGESTERSERNGCG